jgi:hypothetical protein
MVMVGGGKKRKSITTKHFRTTASIDQIFVCQCKLSGFCKCDSVFKDLMTCCWKPSTMTDKFRTRTCYIASRSFVALRMDFSLHLLG